MPGSKKCPPDCGCGSHRPYPRPSPEERFWAKVIKPDGEDGCWLWTGAVCGKPGSKYGHFLVDGRKVKVHRFSWELAKGLSIPKGYQVDHRPTCPKICVNPAHLRLVTNKQNNENLAGAHANSKTGIRGVSWHSRVNRWVGQVVHYGKPHSRYFATEEEAEAWVIMKRNELFTHNDMDRNAPATSGSMPTP